jgi:hypothetical protein
MSHPLITLVERSSTGTLGHRSGERAVKAIAKGDCIWVTVRNLPMTTISIEESTCISG